MLHAGGGDERGLRVVGPPARHIVTCPLTRDRRQRPTAPAGHSRASASRSSAARAHTALDALPVRSPAARRALSLGLILCAHTGARVLHLSRAASTRDY